MKKLLSLVLAVLLTMSMLSVASAEQSKVKLTIMYGTDSGRDLAGDWIRHAYEQWDKKDQVELELLSQTSSHTEMFAKADLMMQSEDTAPDIYLDDSFQAVSDSAAGYLMDMSEALSSWTTWTDGSFFEASKLMCRGEHGGIYGIPYSTDTRGLWVNTEILAQAGIADDWQPETWEELLDGLRQIKANVPGVIPFWYRPIANTEGTVVNTLLMALMGTEDGLYDWENGKWNVYSQGLLDAFTFFATTIDEGLTGPASEMI
ncbi:MAG: extracellular solute-binding protein, partial [Clostridia bacterium]|nr:extracellular solute-binding protein [Clostridia bacterium]